MGTKQTKQARHLGRLPLGLCAKLNRQEKTLIDEFRVLPSGDSAMMSIRQKWAHAWRGRGFVFVSDAVPEGMDVTHTSCLIVCRRMP